MAKRSAILFALILAIAGVFLISLFRVSSPHLLMPQGGVHWLGAPTLPQIDGRDNQFQLSAFESKARVAVFRNMFQVSSVPVTAIAHLRSLGQAELFINDKLALRSREGANLLNSFTLDLAPYLNQGQNEIVVIVMPTQNPGAILFHWEIPGSIPLGDWQVSADSGANWSETKPVNSPLQRPANVLKLTSVKGLLANIEFLLFMMMIGGVGAVIANRIFLLDKTGDGLTVLKIWRWLLVGSLATLYVWNFKQLPPMLGMDVLVHLEYVEFILSHGSLPLADQGWQMFQPPLAYLLGAAVEPLIAAYAPDLTPTESLRILAILCSLGIAWTGCRICEIVFKDTGTAAATMLVTTFLPVNIYMGQAFGNEIFAAFFGSLLILESVRLIKGDQITYKVLLRFGLWTGLGLLSKPTVLILLPGVLLVVINRKKIESTYFAGMLSAGVILLISTIISGWWYIRNIIHFGHPFVGGWEGGRGLDWWQYPGFRIPEHWLRFGESLMAPFYSGLDSFWDGVYSTIWMDGNLSGQIALKYAPPWNLYPMAGLALFSLPLLALMLGGVSRAIGNPDCKSDRNLALFAGGTIVIFLMAMALIFGRVPFYSSAKGSYLLSAITCVPILVGLGMSSLMKYYLGRVICFAFLAAWAGLVIMAFAVS